MNKAKTVIDYYVLCNKLKNIVRTGWKDWNVNRYRVESIAEHIYGVQMLAIAMYKTYEYKIDIEKVILMLALHETEEIFIGDITMFDKPKEEKTRLGHKAIHKMFNEILEYEELEKLLLEFDARESKEAKFAYQCDKLECDLQAKLYSEENCVDLNNQQNNKSFYDSRVQKLLEEEKDFGKMWIQFGLDLYPYDDNFKEVSKYAKEEKINN